MDIIQKLNNLKKKIDDAKQNKARKEGQYEELIKTLHTYNCNDIEEAQLLIDSLIKEKEEKEKEIETRLKKLIEEVNRIENQTDWS